MSTLMRLMQCPWCGTALWQATEAPGTTAFCSTANCSDCGYRYEATCDPVSGTIVEQITPGVGNRPPGAEDAALGPPEELTPEHRQWIRQQISEAEQEGNHEEKEPN